MLCIDKSSDTASLLYFCHHMQGNRRLTTGLRSVYLDDSSLRNTAQSQCNIQAQGAGRNRLYIHIRTRITQLHHRAFSVCFLNLCQRSIQCFQLVFFIHLSLQSAAPRPITNKRSKLSSIIADPAVNVNCFLLVFPRTHCRMLPDL